MPKRARRKDHSPFRLPDFDTLADRSRDTGAPNRNRIVVAEIRPLDRDTRPAVQNYSHDPIMWMLKRGTICPRLAEAGCRFRERFNIASGSGVKAMDWAEPIGGGVSGAPLFPAGGEAWISWRREVQPALDALGTADNPMRLIAWHVLGCGKSLTVFAVSVGWGGVRPRDKMQASGVLMCCLTTLADHYQIVVDGAGLPGRRR